MIDSDPTSPIALVYETSGSIDGSLASALAELGWRARVAGRDARALLREDAQLWAVVLSPSAPNSLAFLRDLRRLRARVPLLVAVADRDQLPLYSGEIAPLLRDWSASADLLVWPPAPDELGTRVARLLPGAGSVYERGPLRVDADRYRVTVGARSVELSHTEFRILLALVEGEGRVVPRPKLLALSRGEGQRQQQALESHMTRLRDKLEGAGLEPGAIRTIRGVGYRLELA